MRTTTHRFIIASLVLLSGLFAIAVSAQTIGLQTFTPGNTDGYVLFSPIQYTSTYLIDKCGRSVHRWSSTYKPGQAVYLLDDGSLMRAGNANNTTFNTGGKGGVVERIDQDGNVTWSYLISDAQQCSHHDIFPMPNGNVLVIAWERHSVAQAVAAGRDPSLLGNSLWSEKILELEPVGSNQANIVWEWHLWDHLVQHFDSTKANYAVVADHPELANLNFVQGIAQADWIHANAIDYNADLDQILLSAHNFNEVWVIDHSTTTAQSAAHIGGDNDHGGDLLYRWGNPRTYDRGTTADQKLYGQHNAQWIRAGLPRAGDIIAFNNGLNRPGTPYSAIDIFAPAVDASGHYMIGAVDPYAPDTLTYEWTAPTPGDFYAQNISGAQALANGGFMVCDGPAGTFFELDANGDEVWRYICPVNTSGPMTQGDVATDNLAFRCTWIAEDDPGLSAFPLAPGEPIELLPIANACATLSIVGSAQEHTFSVSPVPTDGLLRIDAGTSSATSISVFDALGRVAFASSDLRPDGITIDLSALRDGCYTLRITNAENRWTSRIVIAH